MPKLPESGQAGANLFGDQFDRATGGQDCPIVILARIMFDEMDRLEPGNGRSWDELSVHNRDFYRLVISAILKPRDVVTAAFSHCDHVPGRCEE